MFKLIQSVLKFSNPQNIIYANPSKSLDDITYSNNNNTPLPPNPNDSFWIMVMMASSCGMLNIMREIFKW